MFHRTSTLLLVTCLGHVLLISAQVQSHSGVPIIEAAAFGTVARVQAVAAGTADSGRSLWTKYFWLRGVARENEDLKQRVLELQGQLQAEQAKTSRTKSLEEALALRETLAVRTLAARVIAGNPSPGALTVIIDRGTDDGVQPDLAVIAGAGVVGRVIGHPAAHEAQVQLLIGRNANAGAMLEKSGTGAIIAGGSADGLFRLELLKATTEVMAGDRVMSSGQDGLYPQGFLIGTIDWIEGKGKDRVIAVKPAVDFSHIEVVLVVLDRPGPATTSTVK